MKKIRLKLKVLTEKFSLICLTVGVCLSVNCRRTEQNEINKADNMNYSYSASPTPIWTPTEATLIEKNYEGVRAVGDEYARLLQTKGLPKKMGGGGYLKEKAIVIIREDKEKQNEKQYEYLQGCEGIPLDYCAQNPEEIGSIIVIDSSRREVGMYNYGVKAIVIIWNVSVIDKTIPAVVATRRFEGGEPPKVIMQSYPGSNPSPYGSYRSGDPPSNKLEDFLNKIPKR